MTFFRHLLLLSTFLVVIFLSACHQPARQEVTDFAENIALLDTYDIDDLEALLDKKQHQDFYEALKTKNLASVRAQLEQRSRAGKRFNYGVLVNANIITAENRKIFKPKIKQIEAFSTIPNNSLCYFNSAVYNIANNSFFDDFLEIDIIYAEAWLKRPRSNLLSANKIIRSLRELVYEIRLGKNTSPEALDALRRQHIQAFDNLDNIDLIVDFYRELLLSYDFDNIIHHRLDLNNSENPSVETIVNIDFTEKKVNANGSKKIYKERVAILPNYTFGIVGQALRYIATNHGSRDIYYLDLIMVILDPWGHIARSMTAHAFDVETYSPFSDIFLGDLSFYINKFHLEAESALAFGVESGDKKYIIRLIHNAINNKQGEAVRIFRKANSKEESGRITSLKEAPGNFRLTAKSRFNHNHQIAELYRYARNKWETHTFFGAPSFADNISAKDSDGYKDYLYYFRRK